LSALNEEKETLKKRSLTEVKYFC